MNHESTSSISTSQYKTIKKKLIWEDENDFVIVLTCKYLSKWSTVQGPALKPVLSDTDFKFIKNF